jgi:HprK-related kinase A
VSCDCYDILGQRVIVRATSGEFAARVGRLLRSFPFCSEDKRAADVTLSLVVAPPGRDPAIRPFHFLHRDGFQIGRTTYERQLFRFLECQLDILLAEKVDGSLLLHAGAVARNGAGVLLPGPSGSGKSSLSLALLQSGYTYFSDEVGVVDPATGWLHPFPKPVSIKDLSLFGELGRRNDLWFGPDASRSANGSEGVWYLHPEDLTSKAVGGPTPIRYIIFPGYHRDNEPRLLPLAPGEALKELINNSINLSRLGNEGFHLLATLARQARCFSLQAGDLETSLALVSRLTV